MSILKSSFRLISACFLVAFWIWCFYLVQIQLSHLNYIQGVQMGLSQCGTTGVVEPKGVAQVRDIEIRIP